MLFVTNRRIEGSRRSEAGRSICFAPGDPEPGASLYFCQRLGPDRYVELTATPFFSRLRRSPRRQVLFFVHGFSCQPEKRVFPDALQLQTLCDALEPGLVEVVAVVWPCDDDFGLLLDYWDDQHSATVSGFALARMLGKFGAWRDRLGTGETCLKHVNVVAHSMGNRVLATALASWAHDYGVVPALFRNLFLVAADSQRPVRARTAGCGPERGRAQCRRLSRGGRLRVTDQQGRQPQKPDRPPSARPHRPGARRAGAGQRRRRRL